MSTACKITQSNTCNTFTRSLSTLSQRKTRRTGRHVCLSALPVATLLSPSLRENITLFPILVLALSWKENLGASIGIGRFYLYLILLFSWCKPLSHWTGLLTPKSTINFPQVLVWFSTHIFTFSEEVLRSFPSTAMKLRVCRVGGRPEAWSTLWLKDLNNGLALLIFFVPAVWWNLNFLFYGGAHGVFLVARR